MENLQTPQSKSAGQINIEALHCLLFHGDGGHIGGKNCIESMEAALQYGRHHHGKSKQRKASITQ